MKQAAAKKMKQRSAGKPDIELGKRIRLRRVEQKISQAELGDKLGVSFQQVQKYEKGVNRVGAARLQQIATALDVPVTFFYDGDGKAREVESLLFLDSAFSLRLLRAYSKIKDQTVQRQLVSLMESIGDIDSRVEPQKRELRPHCIVKRAAVFTPQVRRAATRHARRRVAVHGVGRMFGAVIGDDRRAIVVGAEIETGAGILLDVDFVGETANLPPRQFAL